MRLVPADEDRGVELEEMVVASMHGPAEVTVADVDGVDVRTESA